jgi:hypothetical protein
MIGLGTDLAAGLGSPAALSRGLARSPSAIDNVVHMTSRSSAESIESSGKIGGRWGIFGVEQSKVPDSKLGRFLKTLVAGDTSQEIELAGKAAEHFRRPPGFGPFSAARRSGGVVNTPLGTIDLESGIFKAGEYLTKGGEFRPATRSEQIQYAIHQALLDYGVDLGFYGLQTSTSAAKHQRDQNP